jgi:hypothetical protein
MRFVPNPAGIPEVETLAALDALLSEKANEAKRQAEVAAPDVTGYYKERFVLGKVGKGYRLGNLDPFAHLVEAGSIHNPPYSPLRRGAQAAGLHLREAPKP